MNEVPAVLAVTAKGVPTSVARVELHVVEVTVAESSICNTIWLLAVTAVVLIVRVLPVPVGNATDPDHAAPQTAGDAPLAHIVVEPSLDTLVTPAR